MCYPVAIALAGLALTAATTAYSYNEQSKATKAQNEFNQEAADEGSKLANESFKQQASAVQLRQTQEADAVTQAKTENAKKAAQARATARVAAGEAGVSGLSVDALMNEYSRQEADQNSALTDNLASTNSQLQSDLGGIRANALDRSLSLRRPGVNGPSAGAAALGFASQATDIYRQYRYDSHTKTGAA